MFSLSTESSPKSLKEQNEPKLYAFTAFQFALFGILFAIPNLSAALQSDLITGIFGAVALGGIAVAATVLTDVLPTSWKDAVTHGFVPQSTYHARKVATKRLTGTDQTNVLKLFDLEQVKGVSENGVFDKIREALEYSAATQQAYKKYLLVREYAIIQILIFAPLVGLSYCVFGASQLYYLIYMIALTLALIVAVNTTDHRHVEVVLKRASFVHTDISEAIAEGRVRPLESKKSG